MKWLMRALGIIWVPAGLVLLLIYLSWQDWSWDWSVFGGFATWVLAGGVFFIFWQIMEARRGTHAQVAVELFRELRSNETLKNLRFIYGLKPEEIKDLLDEGPDQNKDKLEKIVHVLDRFELLGALVKQGIIDERLAIEAYGGPPVVKCWYQLGELYIKEIRKQRGLFCKYVQDFARRTVRYQLKRAPKDEWICFLKEIPVKRSEDRINLIEVLQKDELLFPKGTK